MLRCGFREPVRHAQDVPGEHPLPDLASHVVVRLPLDPIVLVRIRRSRHRIDSPASCSGDVGGSAESKSTAMRTAWHKPSTQRSMAALPRELPFLPAACWSCRATDAGRRPGGLQADVFAWCAVSTPRHSEPQLRESHPADLCEVNKSRVSTAERQLRHGIAFDCVAPGCAGLFEAGSRWSGRAVVSPAMHFTALA